MALKSAHLLQPQHGTALLPMASAISTRYSSVRTCLDMLCLYFLGVKITCGEQQPRGAFAEVFCAA